MITTCKQFLADFSTSGCGVVEGSRWTAHLAKETFKARESYKTAAQILIAEAGARGIVTPRSMMPDGFGQGGPEDPMGWYADPSRQNEPVYFEEDSLAHAHKTGAQRGHQTKHTTVDISYYMSPKLCYKSLSGLAVAILMMFFQLKR